jgi:capsular polysaccharide biosynthesis protein
MGVCEDQAEYYNANDDACLVDRALIPLGLRGSGRVDPLMAHFASYLRSCAAGDDALQPAERRLYVSREKWGNVTRRLANAEAVGAIADEFGFEQVFPETMSVVEQVRLFRSASLIVGDYGSALHNAMFSGRGAFVIALRGTEAHPGFLQSGLGEVIGQDVGYVFGKTMPTQEGHAYTISGDDLRGCLDLAVNVRR